MFLKPYVALLSKIWCWYFILIWNYSDYSHKDWTRFMISVDDISVGNLQYQKPWIIIMKYCLFCITQNTKKNTNTKHTNLTPIFCTLRHKWNIMVKVCRWGDKRYRIAESEMKSSNVGCQYHNVIFHKIFQMMG